MPEPPPPSTPEPGARTVPLAVTPANLDPAEHLGSVPGRARLDETVAAEADAVDAVDVELRPEGVGRRVGRYRLRQWLGAGGMGSVYEANDPSLDRTVAIKLLLRSMDDDARIRMEREARALARLSHPNVVQIYEIGQADRHTFIAMELVRGQTLDVWHKRSPSWRECVRVYIQAGRGLAAAHAEGLVHRDFKPSNCILGDDGRVRVLDFGLARQGENFVAEPEDSPGGSKTPSGPVAAVGLTRTGAFMGTPAYMPLEQLEGQVVDAAADQFSFCVSLYEAVYGERPFEGCSVGELASALAEGVSHVPGRGHGVPARLRRLLVQGLARAPADRWPSMDALVEALGHLVQPRRWRWALGLLGGGLVVAVAGLWQQARVASQRCTGAAEQLWGVWDEVRQQEVRSALLGTGVPYAQTTTARVEEQLGEYGRAWSEMHEATCEATHVRHEQTEDVMALRMACLGSRRIALREAVDVLAQADTGVAQRAVELVAQLDPLTRCEDVERLQTEVEPPADEVQAREVQAIRARLARAQALEAVGQFQRSLEELDTLWQEAESLGYEPLLAEIEYRRGAVLQEQGLYDEARTVLESGWSRAVEHGHDSLATELANLLVFVAGSQQQRLDQGMQWGTVALAFAERWRDPSVKGSVLVHIGMIHRYRGASEEALEHLKEGLAIKERVLGPEHIHVAITMGAIAGALEDQGRFEESLEYWARALAIDEHALGLEHPHVAVGLANMGRVLMRSGNLDEAQLSLSRARTIYEQAGDRSSVASTLGLLGQLRFMQGRLSDAGELLAEAVAVIEGALGPTHLSLSIAVANLGNVRYEQGRVEEALRLHRRGLSIREAALGVDDPQLADSVSNVALLLREQGQLGEAQHLQRRALLLYEKARGPRHADVAETMFELGLTLEQAGHVELARDQVERARRIYVELPAETHVAEVLALVDQWLAEH